jgi:hypothetical protein
MGRDKFAKKSLGISLQDKVKKVQLNHPRLRRKS